MNTIRSHKHTSFLLAVSLVGACVTPVSIERGAFFERRAVDEDTQSRARTEVVGNRAHVVVDSTVCTTYADVYHDQQVQEVYHPSYLRMFLGLGFALGGAALVNYGWEDSTLGGEGMSKAADAAFIAGAPLTLMGTLMFTSSPFGGETYFERVPLETTQADTSLECVDAAGAVKGPVGWTLHHGGARASGATDGSGELALIPALLSVLQALPAEPVAQRLVAQGAMAFELSMGDAEPVAHALQARDVPAARWAAWATEVERTLPSDRRLRWEACGDVAGTHAGALACLWRPQDFATVREFNGDLAPVGNGEFGASMDVRAGRGESFSYRLLLPASNLDWIAQVTSLDTGVVIAEQLSTASDRLTLKGVFPQEGNYVLVLNADQPGRYRSILTVSR